jgi:hypothetical protein
MIKVDSFCKSHVKDYEEYVEAVGWFCQGYHDICIDFDSSVFAGPIGISDFWIVTYNGEHGPKILQNLVSGKASEVEIVRLGWTEGEVVKLQTVIFEHVQFTIFQQDIQFIYLGGRVGTKSISIDVLEQDTGESSGSTSYFIDLETGKGK